MTYHSKRGMPLVDAPLASITVEFYEKWYELYRINIYGAVDALSFGVLEPIAARMDVSAFRDHCPNPDVVRQYAEENGLHLPQQVDELITGRWALEWGYEPSRGPF
jgi:hypothetical protein